MVRWLHFSRDSVQGVPPFSWANVTLSTLDQPSLGPSLHHLCPGRRSPVFWWRGHGLQSKVLDQMRTEQCFVVSELEAVRSPSIKPPQTGQKTGLLSQTPESTVRLLLGWRTKILGRFGKGKSNDKPSVFICNSVTFGVIQHSTVYEPELFTTRTFRF